MEYTIVVGMVAGFLTITVLIAFINFCKKLYNMMNEYRFLRSVSFAKKYSIINAWNKTFSFKIYKEVPAFDKPKDFGRNI